MPRRQCGSTRGRKPAICTEHSLRGGMEQSQSGNEIETFQGGNSVGGNLQMRLTCYSKIILRLETGRAAIGLQGRWLIRDHRPGFLGSLNRRQDELQRYTRSAQTHLAVQASFSNGGYKLPTSLGYLLAPCRTSQGKRKQ